MISMFDLLLLFWIFANFSMLAIISLIYRYFNINYMMFKVKYKSMGLSIAYYYC